MNDDYEEEEFSAFVRRRLKRLGRKLAILDADILDVKNMMRQVMKALNVSIAMEIAQMEELNELKSRLAETTNTMEAAKLLIRGLREQLTAMGHMNAAEVKAEVKRIADELNTKEDELAAAMLEGTVAAGEIPGGTGASTGPKE